MNATESRKAWAVMLSAYGLALFGAWLCMVLLENLPIWAELAIADAVATLIIFGFSFFLKNSSMYDPFWSVLPPFLGLGFLLYSPFIIGDEIRIVVVMGLVLWWAIRLTWNFGRGWPGLSHQDWRYTRLNEQTGPFYWLVSFLGIHFFPTALVFLGCLSLWPALTASLHPLNWLDGIALLVTVAAILIETVADNQLRSFKLSQPPREAILKSGLWAWSRHPNYLGELLFWWGLWLFGYAANPEFLWTLIGPLSMTFLFTVVSIPMMDKRMKTRRPAYKEHMRKVPALFPWKGKVKF